MKQRGVVFSGQGHPWVPIVAEYQDTADLQTWERAAARLREHYVALPWELTPTAPTALTAQPICSVPGILAANLFQAAELGVDGRWPLWGHSQGLLAKYALEHDAETAIIAAFLIAQAMQQHAEQESCMWAVHGVRPADLPALDGVEVALRNGPASLVLSGKPHALRALPKSLKPIELEIYAPFHHSSMQPAVAQVRTWAKEVGADQEAITALAQAIMVDPVDFGADFQPADLTLVYQLGTKQPDSFLTQAGAAYGCSVVALGEQPQPVRAYSEYAPTQQDGHLHTAFSERTGYHPIMVGAMTPTTATPELVVAAANAGYWAELAGGGNPTEASLQNNIDSFRAGLRPQARAQFNTMVMDEKQWAFQFEDPALIPAALAESSPFAGITFAAGLPTAEQLAEILQYPLAWVALKLGGTSGIDQALQLAAAHPHTLFIFQLEGSQAGGHHTKKPLDSMLLARYSQIRAQENVLLAVGGGLRPADAPRYFSGQWARDYAGAHTPQMPVDAIFIGTPVMVAAEAPTAPAVKEFLARADYEVTSELSAYGASMYMVDNDFAAAVRICRDPESTPEAIRAALDKTCRPYFGDFDELTYAELLQRYWQLCRAPQWLHPDYERFFTQLLNRVEARLHPQDRGEFETRLAAPTIEAVLVAYPEAEHTIVHPWDASWCIAQWRRGMKPVPFVPVLAEATWWLQRDSLWQCQSDAYEPSEVCITPSPQPQQWQLGASLTEILGSYEIAVIEALDPVQFQPSAPVAVGAWAIPANPTKHSQAFYGPMWAAIYELLDSQPPIQQGTQRPADLALLLHLRHEMAVYEQPAGPITAHASYSQGHGNAIAITVNFYDAEILCAQAVEVLHVRQGSVFVPGPLPAAPLLSAPVLTGEITRRGTLFAPADMTAFVHASGDNNPLHTDVGWARAHGFQAPVVHGMWFVDQAQHIAGQATVSAAEFFAPVLLDTELHFECASFRTALRSGEVVRFYQGEVLTSEIVLENPPKLAYVYPGQGVQYQGMGLELAEHSPEAAAVWERAEQHCCTLGFSLHTIVHDNPTTLEVASHTYRHPRGVLHLTQFTQVALAVVGVAETAHWRAQGELQPHAWFAGHSLGEYVALSAYAEVLPLEALIEIVYERGRTMDGLLERDAAGNTRYAMAVVRPHHFPADFDLQAQLAAIVDAGEFAEIVNWNVRGRQYSIAGTRTALAQLQTLLPERAYSEIPGVDVPFHSRILHDGVDTFRAVLDSHLPATIDADRLAQRYIPNIIGRPMSFTESFIAELSEIPGIGEAVRTQTWDFREPTTARRLLIELLAWQFASPVQWIATTEYLVSEVPVAEIIEMGLAQNPTLSTMMVQATTVPVRNIQRDVAAPTVQAQPSPQEPPIPAAQTKVAAAEHTAPQGPDTLQRLRFLSGWWLQRDPASIDPTTTVEALTGGVSARRNQLVADIQAEFHVAAIPQLAELPLAELAHAITARVGETYAFGSVLRAAIPHQLQAQGLSPAQLRAALPAHWAQGYNALELSVLLDPPTDLAARVAVLAPEYPQTPRTNTAEDAQSAALLRGLADVLADATMSASPVTSTTRVQEPEAPQREQIRGTEPQFIATHIRCFDDVWAYARERRWHGAGPESMPDSTQRVLVTGVSPHSIGEQLVAQLLHNGAEVIVTTSTRRFGFLRALYGVHARGSAKLWVIPANLGSFADIDGVCSWLHTNELLPDTFYPLAAPAVGGSIADIDDSFEYHMRVLVWGVERMIRGLATTSRRLKVLLAGSPNRGVLGADGGYGEAKAALDVLQNKWFVEPWLRTHTVIGQVILGWVTETNLMRSFDASGIDNLLDTRKAANLLLAAASQLHDKPQTWDFSGDFGLHATWLRAQATTPKVIATKKIQALPNLPQLPAQNPRINTPQRSLADLVVVCGIGEIGAWGTSHTRYEAEFGQHLSAAGIIELAWALGFITYEDGAWTYGQRRLHEAQLAAELEDVVLARCGLREFEPADIGLEGLFETTWQELSLHRSLRLPVDYSELAEQLATQPGVQAHYEATIQSWEVVFAPGTTIRVPRRTTVLRVVGGPIATGFDPARYGIPEQLRANWDRLTLWNLIATIEAFLAAGIDPTELTALLDPTRVGSTQSTGMGAQQATASLYARRLFGEHLPNDIVQETLGNVVAAHIIQSYVGAQGTVQPTVGACATAAVSIEAAIDKIELGKADIVLAGAIDDFTKDSLAGFAMMEATADNTVLASEGYDPAEHSRPNDAARRGFVEAAGGGTVIVARASIAADLGLPVHAVLAGAESYTDGVATSIPAPGNGLKAAAHGNLLQRLKDCGVGVADIAVVSKHDTSTQLNDPHETVLIDHILKQWGRESEQLVAVISQKALTGHAKGGAGVFQLAGLIDAMRTSTIPAQRNLDVVDPELASSEFFVWPRTPARRSIAAGLLSSLGFGHIGTLVAVVHPYAFELRLAAERGPEALSAWQHAATQRHRRAWQRKQKAMQGEASLYHPQEQA
ncbi:MAG: DUF1729 domain-containing protein [Corynebacterium sp.]|nr:DUF1729 domain-containing protein [Corynebacterium sp.]